jgi:hypothetical protein
LSGKLNTCNDLSIAVLAKGKHFLKVVNFKICGPLITLVQSYNTIMCSRIFGKYFDHNDWCLVFNATFSYKPITYTTWVRARLCKLQKGCARLAAASDKVCQLLAHGRWFSPASSTTKTGHHDIAEILLKVALNHQNSINY